MRTLFWLLTLAALAIGIALLGRLTDGYVLWVLPPWRAEVSFNLFVLLQLLALLVVYLFLRLIVNTLRLPARVAQYRARRARHRRARAALAAARLFWEGRYSQTLKAAEQACAEPADGAETPESAADTRGIAALAAFKAAHALRDPVRIALWRRRAEALDAAGWRLARLMAELRIALDARDYATARRVLDQLEPKERRQIAVQRLALRLAHGEGDWGEVLRLSRQLEKHKALAPEQAEPVRQRAYLGMLEALADAPAQLVRFWQEVPAADRRDARLARRAAELLAASGQCEDCARLVETSLDERWDPALLAPYADCVGGDLLARIAQCEKWLNEHPRDADLLRALGRLCLRQQLWGKAQSYLEASLAVAPACTTHLELARLFERLGQGEAAQRHYRAAADCYGGASASQSRAGKNSV